MKIGISKVFFKPGDIEFNYNKILNIYNKCNYDLLIFPEMSLSGYPIYEQVLNKDFIEKNNKYLEKIVDFTSEKKTKLLIGCPYFIEEYTTKDGIIKKSKLFNSMVFINNGYVDEIISKNTIAKGNIFDDYRYFDVETHLKYIDYDAFKLNVLIDDDIFENKNILFLKDRDNDLIICLDSSPENNIEFVKKQLNKIAKFTKKYVIYLNNFTYDFKRNFQFNGQCFVVNNLGEIIYKNEKIKEEVVELEAKIIDGEIDVMICDKNDESENFFDVLKRNYMDKNIEVKYFIS